jgi:hypothetical protein
MNDTFHVRWRKSSYSGHQGGECVEVASLSPMIGVRDSKAPDDPHLTFTNADWQTFTRRIKDSQHDLA